MVDKPYLHSTNGGLLPDSTLGDEATKSSRPSIVTWLLAVQNVVVCAPWWCRVALVLLCPKAWKQKVLRCAGKGTSLFISCHDSRGKIFGDLFSCGKNNWNFKKRTQRLSELDCKGINVFAVCCEGLRFSHLASAFSRIADDW